jgi:hypothetical protein
MGYITGKLMRVPSPSPLSPGTIEAFIERLNETARRSLRAATLKELEIWRERGYGKELAGPACFLKLWQEEWDRRTLLRPVGAALSRTSPAQMLRPVLEIE